MWRKTIVKLLKIYLILFLFSFLFFYLQQKSRNTILIFAPHPDDEAICCSVKILRTLKNKGIVYVVYLTDGAPGDENSQCSWLINGTKISGTCKEYRLIREKEAKNAMKIAGIPEENLIFLRYDDGKLIFSLDDAINNVTSLINKIRPNEIYVPAYEGGNCDHDAANYIVHKSIKFLNFNPFVYEYPEYWMDNKSGKMHVVYQEFIPTEKSLSYKGNFTVISIKMNEEEMKLKKEIMSNYPSQIHILTNFDKNESFRILPKHNYSNPPHERPLYYEPKEYGGLGICSFSFDVFRSMISLHDVA